MRELWILGLTPLAPLMGPAFEVYKEMGYGMAEEIYQGSLEMELADRVRNDQLALF